MNYRSYSVLVGFIACLFVAPVAIGAPSKEKMPPELAGEIPQPTGKIAFIRDGSIWMMDANGANPEMVSEVTNADGRLSWSPDGKTIVFTRNGFIDLKGPDLLGGKHKVNDLFLAYVDSALNNNRMWWYRLTDDLGSRDPEWSADGSRILYWKDMNANQANAVSPNYQVCSMDPDGSDIELLRKDWQAENESFLIAPTRNSKGKLAAVYFFKQKAMGLTLLPQGNEMISFDSIKTWAAKNSNQVAPSWSPDNEWIAYVNNNINDGNLYVASADLSRKYLVFSPPVSTYLYTTASSFSPDSKWLTFASTDGSVWICDISGNGARRLTPPGLDRSPAWSR